MKSGRHTFEVDEFYGDNEGLVMAEVELQSEEEATKILSEEAVTAIADVKMGDATATAWGCDLTYDYIKINADYRS